MLSSLYEASKALEKGQISSEELVTECFKSIDLQEKDVGAFLFLDKEGAIEKAKASDERRRHKSLLSPMDGIPVGLKDMILTKDMPTTAASKILEGYYPPYDATVARKLAEKGTINIGKLNQDEFAMGSSNENSAYKLCRNPKDLTRTPGGSSGGSAAAVAAGFCLGTLGTDTGGSIRQPAAFCGITGIKPTYGRVSRYGVIAFASSLDQVGPFAADIKSAAMMLEAIAGFDPQDSTSVNQPVPCYVDLLTGKLEGLKVGVPKEYFAEGLDENVAQIVREGLRHLEKRGAEIIDISLPMTPHAVATYYVIATAEAASNLSRYDGIRYGPRKGEEKGLKGLYEETRSLFGAEVKRRIMLGTYVLSSGYYDAYYLRAQKVRRLFADDFTRAFQEVDVIVGPTTPTTAYRLGEKLKDPLALYLDDIFTISANLTGLPGLSVKGGFSKEGLPVGIQIIGKAFEEATILNVGLAIEEELKGS